MISRHRIRFSPLFRGTAREQEPRLVSGWVFFLTCALMVGAAQSQSALAAGGIETVWAEPLRGGPITALFVIPENALADVGHVEAAMDVTAIRAPFAVTEGVVSFSEPTLELIERTARKGPDVIVISRIDLDALPERAKRNVHESLKSGAGLVVAHYGHSSGTGSSTALDDLHRLPGSYAVSRGIGVRLLSGLQEGIDEVHLYEGAGRRAVELAYWANAPESHGLLPAAEDDAAYAPMLLDSYVALAVRAVRWASGRDPALRIVRADSLAPAGPEGLDTPPQLPREFIQRMRDANIQPMSQSYELVFDRPSPKKYRVKTQVRYPRRDIRWRYTVDEVIKRGDTSFSLDLPVGSGEFLVDFWLMDGDAVVDWYTDSYQVEGWPTFSDLQFSAFSVDKNDRLEVSLNVRPHFHRPRPCSVFVRATDALGRLVAEQRVVVGIEGGPVKTELLLVDLLTPYIKIELFAADTTQETMTRWMMERAAYGSARILVRQGPERPFRLVVDGSSASEFNVRLRNRALMESGVDTLRVDELGKDFGVPAFDNLEIVPTVASFTAYPCEISVAERREQIYNLEEQASRYSSFGTGLYMLDFDYGAERALCVDDWRRFLEGAYPGIAMLNRAWETTFRSWSEAAEFDASGGLAISPRMDHATFRGRLRQSAYADAQSVIRGIDPQARVGVDRVHGRGLAPSEAVRSEAPGNVFLATPIDHVSVEGARSDLKPGDVALLRPDVASAQDATVAGWLPWYAALHGMQGLWVSGKAEDSASEPRRDEDGLQWMLPFNPALTREVATLRSGFSELLRASRRVRGDVAVYEGRSSHRLDGLVPVGSYSSRRSLEYFTRLLDSLGYTYDIVDYDNIVAGGLGAYRLCVLPLARALSDEELFALEQFHRAGGALFADLFPGRFDEHGRARERFALETVFGVRADGTAELRDEVPTRLDAPSRQNRRGEADAVVSADSSIRLDGAEIQFIAGDIPVGVEMKAAKGAALLLNHAATVDYAASDSIVEDWLRESDVATPIRAMLDAQIDGDVEMVGFRYSTSQIFTFLNAPSGKKTEANVRFDIPEGKHGYDALSSTYFRPGARATLKLAPGEPAILCFLPYAVSRVEVYSNESVARGRRLPVRVQIKTRVVLPDDHMVHVTVTSPRGLPLRHYAKTVACPDGTCETYVPLALNDEPGTYIVTVRDVLTGISGSTDMRVW